MKKMTKNIQIYFFLRRTLRDGAIKRRCGSGLQDAVSAAEEEAVRIKPDRFFETCQVYALLPRLHFTVDDNGFNKVAAE